MTEPLSVTESLNVDTLALLTLAHPEIDWTMTTVRVVVEQTNAVHVTLNTTRGYISVNAATLADVPRVMTKHGKHEKRSWARTIYADKQLLTQVTAMANDMLRGTRTCASAD